MFLLLLGCGSGETWCGFESLTRNRWIDGGPQPIESSEQSVCWTRRDGAYHRRYINDTGGCTVGTDAEGDCHGVLGTGDFRAHVIPEESTISEDEETLSMSLRVWTTDLEEDGLIYGGGDLVFDGQTAKKVDLPPLREEPVCEWQTCYTGTWEMVERTPGFRCDDTASSREGRPHQVAVFPDTFEVDIDGEGKMRAATDLDECAFHYTRDGNAFNTMSFTLTPTEITARQRNQFTTTDTGQQQVCEVVWRIPLTTCP